MWHMTELPPSLLAHPLLVALPKVDTADEDVRARLAVVLEILAQQGFRNVSLHVDNLEPLADLRPVLGARLAFSCHGVFDQASLEQALAASPELVLTDCCDPELVFRGLEAGVPVLPAALTPNEIIAAARLGAPAVQVFPADVMGGAYGPSLGALVDRVAIVPRGGLGGWAVGRWFESRAKACVVDDALIGDAMDEYGNLGQLRDRCGSFLDSLPKDA